MTQNKTFRDFRIFDFGCRVKSKTPKSRKFWFFHIKLYLKVTFFVWRHFSGFLILRFNSDILPKIKVDENFPIFRSFRHQVHWSRLTLLRIECDNSAALWGKLYIWFVKLYSQVRHRFDLLHRVVSCSNAM